MRPIVKDDQDPCDASEQPDYSNATTAWGGSLVVCLATSLAVYVAADSRYASPTGELFDYGRKLVEYGQSGLCGLSGQLRFNRVVTNGHTGEAVSQMSFDLSDVFGGLEMPPEQEGATLAAALGKTLYRALSPIWKTFGGDLDQPFGLTRVDGTATEAAIPLAQILCVNRSSCGEVIVDRVDLKHSLLRTATGRYQSVLGQPNVSAQLRGTVQRPRYFVLGSRECARPTPPSMDVRDDAEALDLLEGAFLRAQRDSQCAASVGGAIDIATIGTGGRRWLKKKPNARYAG